jgi:hypothetical protein
MGKASSYFYVADTSDTQTLHRRIIPSNAQYDEQQVRWNELADFLLSELGKAQRLSYQELATRVLQVRHSDKAEYI